MIPHGVPNLPLVDSDLRKPDFGLEGRSVILSFGLLGPGKGYEHVIEAMSRVRRERPDALSCRAGNHLQPALLSGPPYVGGFTAQGGF